MPSDAEDQDALDALESEAKEFDKVRPPRFYHHLRVPALTRDQDAEIDRILKAFRLDA
jgi:hypothetical protein